MNKLLTMSATIIRKAEQTPWYLAGNNLKTDVVGAYQALGAESYSASLVNLNNPGTNNLIEGTAPTWSSNTGWTFDGLTQFLKTNIVYLNTWSVLCRFSGANTAANAYLIGEAESNREIRLAPNTFGGLGARWYHKDNYVHLPAMQNGVMGLSYKTPYRDGIEDTGGTGTLTDLNAGGTWKLFVGAQNNDGTNPNGFVIANIQAICIYNRTLSPTEMLAVSSAMAALP